MDSEIRNMQKNSANELNNQNTGEITEYRSLIRILNEKLQSTEDELAKYINKFLTNEEKWKIINFFIKKINSTFNLNPIFEIITDDIFKLINLNFIALAIFDEDKNELAVKKYCEKTPKFIPPAMKIDSPKLINKLQNYLEKINPELSKVYSSQTNMSKNELNEMLEEKYHSGFHIELLKTSNEFLGVLFLSKDSNTLSEEEVNILEIITENITMTIQRAKLYEKLKESNRYKREFMAGISHEFKTPLNAIIGFSEILKQKKELDGTSKKYVENILRSSSHLLKLMEEILDMSKAESGKIELLYERFNSKTIILEILSVLENMIKTKNLKLKTHLMDTYINADAKRFRQIIYNLVNNAIKFNNENGEITITTYVKNNNFHFDIEDTGDGIRAKDISKIFQFFSQANTNYLKRQEGSGVGLALCKKIIEIHNGKIGFETKESIGSRFWFFIPM